MKNTDFMNLSLPEGTDKIDVEILNNDFKKLESEASKHYIKQQIEVDGTATIIGSIGPYVQLENLTDNILNVRIGDELVILMKGDNRKIRTISGENYGVVTSGAVRITYYINARTYADENFYKKEKVDELLKNVEATIEVDTELSETSENPVQNKAITQELANYATTAEVESKVTEKVAEIVAGAPEDFDTLKEMSDWLKEHEDSAASMNSAIQANAANIEKKVDKVSGKDLSTNDFTTAYKDKIDDTYTKSESDSITSAISARVAENESDISQLQTDVASKASIFALTETNNTVAANKANLQSQIDTLVVESVGDGNAEVVQARVGVNGTAYATLKTRLDSMHEQINTKISKMSNTDFLAPLLVGHEGFVEVDTINSIITIPRDTSIYSNLFDNGFKHLAPMDADVTVDYSAVESTAVKIAYNVSTSAIEVFKYSDVLNENYVLFCTVRKKNEYYLPSICINAPYKIDGVTYNIDWCVKNGDFLAPLLVGFDAIINFDTNNNIMTIPKDTIMFSSLFSGGYKHLAPTDTDVTVDYSTTSSSAVKIVYNVATSAIEVYNYNAAIKDKYVTVCTVRKKTQHYLPSVCINAQYSIDGKPYNSEIADVVDTYKVDYTENDGYINVDGGVDSQDATKLEKYTSKIRVNKGDVLEIRLSHSQSRSMWVAYSTYTKTPSFIERVVFLKDAWQRRLYERITIDSDNIAFVRFMYRTYNDADIKIIHYRNQDQFAQNCDVLAPLLIGKSGFVELDTTNKTLTIPIDSVMYSHKFENEAKAINFSEELVIDYSDIESTAVKIAYNIDTSEFEAFKYNVRLTENYILLCTIRQKNQYYQPSISINAPYKIDGIAYNIDSVFGENKNVHTVNHRGASEAPENTLAAFRQSKKNGYDMVEADISFTSDGIPVLLHDATIDRTSNGTGNINELTFEHVRTLDFGSWKGEKYTGELIPSFEEFIVLCKNIGLHPYIELKSSATYTEEQIQSLVYIAKRNGMKGNVTWISFNVAYLGYVKNSDTTARLGYLLNKITDSDITLANNLKTANNEVFVDVNYTTINIESVEKCIANDLPLEAWTVNDENALLALDSYITGYTSDSLLAGKILMISNINNKV